MSVSVKYQGPGALLLVVIVSALLTGDEQELHSSKVSEETQDLQTLRPGDAAPEWHVSSWTDGKSRKLADYHGRVLVIEFWGIWCGPCIRMIPAIKDLQTKFENDDVVFLGLHSVGTSQADVTAGLSKYEWQMPTAIDAGSSLADSVTATLYGVAGYPTLVIVDRKGNVAYHSGRVTRQAFMERAKYLASQLELPWPIDKDYDDVEELSGRLNQLAIALYGGEIRRALKRN